jgi:hypothetical protein
MPDEKRYVCLTYYPSFLSWTSMGRCERLAVVEVLRRVLRQVGGSDEQSEAILLLLVDDMDLRREARAILADARSQPRLHPGPR